MTRKWDDYLHTKNPRVPRIPIECAVCKEPMVVLPCMIPRKKLCGKKECSNKWKSIVLKGRSQTLEQRQTTAKAVKKIWEGRSREERKKITANAHKATSTWFANITEEEKLAKMQKLWSGWSNSSTIEIMVQDVLTSMDVEFIPNARFFDEVSQTTAIPDIYIPNLSLVIECDGDYWHSLPKNQERDRQKNEIYARMGLRCARIPEHAIRKDVLGAVGAALEGGDAHAPEEAEAET